MRKLKTFIIFLLLSKALAAQEMNKKISFKWNVDFWSTYVSYPDNPPVKRSAGIGNNSFSLMDTLKDAPIKHGACYVALKSTTIFTPGIQVKLDLYAEHRGISYGIYNQKNLVLYPVMQLQLKDSVRFLKHKLALELKVGDFLDKRLDEGLFIYNVDAQGGEGTISSGGWTLSTAWYGDFYAGIGLNIDDAVAVSLSKRFGKQRNTIAGLSIYSLYPPAQQFYDHLYYSIFFRHGNAKLNVYTQVGFQSSYKKGSFYSRGVLPQSAFVLGSNAVFKQRKFSGSATLEIRYYGSSVNFLHTDPRLRYRDVNGGLYGNTVGDYLYPLRKYDNSFSQWAAFTEYFGYHVFAASLAGNAEYAVSKKTTAIFEYDLDYITATRDPFYHTAEIQSEILYAFLTAGYYYTPIKTFKAGIIITNKGMNLNLGYPALFEFKKFYWGFKIRCTI